MTVTINKAAAVESVYKKGRRLNHLFDAEW